MKKLGFSLLFAMMLFGVFAAVAFAAPSPSTPDPAPGFNTGMNPAEPVTNLENANGTATGVNDQSGAAHDTVVKAEHVHSAYQNNTNACASCHQTHTASGEALLFADTVYQTCTACHDGTLGFANVFADGSTAKMSGAGTFGGTHGASMHMSNDSLTISAAPGGNPVATSTTKGTQWGESFNCASCHAPHGSYSDRLLHYNPNGIAAIPVSQGGNQLVDVKVVDTLGDQTDAVVLYRTTDETGKVTVAQYNKVSNGYTKATAPWVYGYSSRTNGMTYYSRLQLNATTAAASGADKDVYFDYEHAQVCSTGATGATKLNNATLGAIARPVVVKMAKNGHNIVQDAYWNGATVAVMGGDAEAVKLKELGYNVASGKVTNIGVKMSQFCAACHSDYLGSSGDGKQSYFGAATEAHGHSTNSDSYTCVRCHYSHGTDAEIMKDALGRTVADLQSETVMGTGKALTKDAAMSYMTDNNSSSALKKYTNMSVCWACHNSSHAESIKNTNRPEDHPVGMPIVGGIQQ